MFLYTPSLSTQINTFMFTIVMGHIVCCFLVMVAHLMFIHLWIASYSWPKEVTQVTFSILGVRTAADASQPSWAGLAVRARRAQLYCHAISLGSHLSSFESHWHSKYNHMCGHFRGPTRARANAIMKLQTDCLVFFQKILKQAWEFPFL